jgi:hypothetical protein
MEGASVKNVPINTAAGIDWMLFVTALGFLVTWVASIVAHMLSKAKNEGRMEQHMENVDSRIKAVKEDQNRAISSIRQDMNDSFNSLNTMMKTFSDNLLDADGDPKYITGKVHTAICAAHSKNAQMQFEAMHHELADIKAAQKAASEAHADMQNKILMALTNDRRDKS